jgi:hypothetical protein
MDLTNIEKEELLKARIAFLESVYLSELEDLESLVSINSHKISIVQSDILDRRASIDALIEELYNITR